MTVVNVPFVQEPNGSVRLTVGDVDKQTVSLVFFLPFNLNYIVILINLSMSKTVEELSMLCSIILNFVLLRLIQWILLV